MSACIGEPISWLRLETYAVDHRDAAVRDHVGACEACRGCLAEIERDVVALPPLVVAVRKRRTWWPMLLVPVAAAAVLLLVLRPRPHDGFTVKGVGDVSIGVVRERAGTLTYDARTYRAADRWKVFVTCPPSAGAFIDVDVGGDHPLAPALIACGNRVVLPGAFTLNGGTNRVCVNVSSGPGVPGGQSCVTIRPE